MSDFMSAKTFIVGYGNPLRGDDGFGPAAAEALRAQELPGVEVVVCHQLTPELAEPLAKSDLAIFIDVAADIGAGEIVIRQITDESLPSSLGHHFEPSALIAIARRLYGGAPQSFLVKVGAETFEFGEKLSDTVENAMPAVIAAINQLVRNGK
jgi:hydrogenase maturation protease